MMTAQLQRPGGLGVTSNATWWSTARSGGRDGLGATTNEIRFVEGLVSMGLLLGAIGALYVGLTRE